MGIDSYANDLLKQEAEVRPFSGDLLTLGVQRVLLPSGQVNDVEYFKGMGFSDVKRMDISGYEGADYIEDLNERKVFETYLSFDCIFDGGTLEHVFDFPAALVNIFRHLKIGGRIIHQLPINNYCDHGFWQVSPRLLKAYYEANNFEVLSCIPFQTNNMVHFCAIKNEQSTCHIIPQQVF
jgi:hypothetical protein